jgi:hypothetical protein
LVIALVRCKRNGKTDYQSAADYQSVVMSLRLTNGDENLRDQG